MNKEKINKDTGTSTFIAALLTIAKLWKQPRCPTTNVFILKNSSIYIYIYIYTYNGILFNYKEE
jgi:hypothetical protein